MACPAVVWGPEQRPAPGRGCFRYVLGDGRSTARSRWIQDGCVDGDWVEACICGEGKGARSRALFQLRVLAAGWMKKTDRKSMIGGFVVSELGDQKHWSCWPISLLSLTESELSEGRSKGRGAWRLHPRAGRPLPQGPAAPVLGGLLLR